MQGKKPGSLSRFVCQACGKQELVSGGSSYFVCSACKPADHHTRTAQYQAHQAVARARRLGQLDDPRKHSCADCKAPAIEYDHRDYSRPLDVQPVCRRCNLKRGPAIGSAAYKAQTESA